MNIFVQIALSVLVFCSVLCLYRIAKGPSAPDRTVAIDILGTLIVGFCCIMAVWPGREREYYMNIAIAWALISFVGTLALAKYLEGRSYDA